MIVKVEDEYLDFDGEITVERQVMNVDTLENVGNFSYSFTVQPTSKNKRLLGLTSIDGKNKTIFVKKACELQTDAGIAIHYGAVLVTNSFGIDCSFISGNTNFFNLIQGNVNEVDLSGLDAFLSQSLITNSWSATSGMVFPIIDRGELSNRKMPFLGIGPYTLLYGDNENFITNDFQPFIYVKDIVNAILQKAGLKIEGDLLKDGTYSSLITTQNSNDFKQKKFDESNVYVGKTISQTINSTTFTQITFDDDTNNQFFNSTLSAYKTGTSDWYTYLKSVVNMFVTLDFSDPTKLVEVQLRKNGETSDRYRDFLKGSTVEFMGDKKPERFYTFNSDNGDYWEIWAKVDASTPGTLNVTSGTFKGTIEYTAKIFAQSYLPESLSRDFIKDIFTLFNVICSYDIFSKTIHTRLFKDIANQPEQDLSAYLTGYNSEPGLDVVSGYAKQNAMAYNSDDSDEVIKYNKTNKIPYGDGQIIINNDFIDSKKDLRKVMFTAPYTKLYPVFGLQLIKLKFFEYTDSSPIDFPPEFTSVTNSSGLATFNGTPLYGNLYKGTSKGTIQNLLGGIYINGALDRVEYVETINTIESKNQILAVHVPNFNLPKQIGFPASFDTFRVNVSNSGSNVPSYSGDWEKSDGTPTPLISSASLAAFAKFPDGTDLDRVKQGLAFNPGLGGLSLIETYYRKTSEILNDPSKVIPDFVMPENVYRNIDFLRPVRLKTEFFDSLFYINKDIGYVDGKTPFQMELIKIN